MYYGAEVEPEENHYDYDDDGLGYYEDGVKRTLTDEQIAMFRHTEIQAILRERRLKREAQDLSEGELSPEPLKENPPEVPAEPVSHSYTIPAPIESREEVGSQDGVQHGRADKPNNWTKISNKTKERIAKSRKKYRKLQKEKRRNMREGSTISKQTEEAEESDEWDPWHQANGPDAQKDTTVDLDY